MVSLPHACRRGFASAAFVVLSAAAIPAEATTVRAQSLEEKVETAAVIVHARVERVTTEWEIPDAKMHTLITMRVLEGIKGEFQPGERIIVRRGGGKIGDMEVSAPGLAQYSPGEDVVMFLEPYDAYYVAIGIGVGTYDVKPARDQPWVHHAPNVSGVRFIDGRTPRIEPILPMVPEPLSVFLKKIRSHARKIPMAPRAVGKSTRKVMLKPRPALAR